MRGGKPAPWHDELDPHARSRLGHGPSCGLAIVRFLGGPGLGGVVLLALYGRQLPHCMRVVSVSVNVIAAITLAMLVRNTLGN